MEWFERDHFTWGDNASDFAMITSCFFIHESLWTLPQKIWSDSHYSDSPSETFSLMTTQQSTFEATSLVSPMDFVCGLQSPWQTLPHPSVELSPFFSDIIGWQVRLEEQSWAWWEHTAGCITPDNSQQMQEHLLWGRMERKLLGQPPSNFSNLELLAGSGQGRTHCGSGKVVIVPYYSAFLWALMLLRDTYIWAWRSGIYSEFGWSSTLIFWVLFASCLNARRNITDTQK